MMKSQSDALDMLFIPCLSPNQGISLVDLARVFAAHGQRVTIIATESIAAVLEKTIDKDTASGHHISLHRVQLPNKEAGLPDGIDNFSQAKDEHSTGLLFVALTLLRQQIEDAIGSGHPDCIVSDAFYWWTAEVAASFHIPRLVYYPLSVFTLCLKDTIPNTIAPHLNLKSNYDAFLIPGLPDPITMTLSQLPYFVRTLHGHAILMEQYKEADRNSYSVLVNSFHDLDPAYIEHYKKTTGHNVIPIGPTDQLMTAAAVDLSDHQSLKWLNSKKPNSVLYVCFSSWSIFSDQQLIEIACALEDSGCQFLWNIFGSKDYDEEEERKILLPEGYEKKIHDRGMIYKGWDTPDSLILEHPSICGFMTHSEWKSVIGGIYAGVPMIFWSWSYEHFLTEKFATQVLGIGVEVGAMDCNYWFDVEKIVIRRETIEKAVRKMMNGGDEVEEMRRKAIQLMNKAKSAVEEGGSSHRNLTTLIQDLKKLRDSKTND